MKKWEKMSSAELGAVLQRLYMRLEQYEIHAASLAESPERNVSMVLAGRMRESINAVSALLDRRLAEATGQGAHMQAGHMERAAATRDDTSGNSEGRVA
jgi:hypothetical protein